MGLEICIVKMRINYYSILWETPAAVYFSFGNVWPKHFNENQFIIKLYILLFICCMRLAIEFSSIYYFVMKIYRNIFYIFLTKIAGRTIYRITKEHLSQHILIYI